MSGKPLRVVCLFGSGIIFDKTLSILLEENVNVVGVCYANRHKSGVDFSYLRIALKNQGWRKVFGQIAGRLYYKLLNSRKDRRIFNRLYNPEEIYPFPESRHYKVRLTESYSDPETLKWIKELEPDLLLAHTGYWVGKRVRDLVGGRIIGGHPGITPDYRGVHSPFWAMYNGEPEKIGYSVFWLDSGVDTGDILYQAKILPEKGDSYFTLSWKGMIGIAENQARIIKEMDEGIEPETRKAGETDESTNYTHPTLSQYLKYRRKQKKLR